MIMTVRCLPVIATPVGGDHAEETRTVLMGRIRGF
jgi:hypothetical protein